VVDEAFCPQSITLELEHDIDISRGSMVVGVDYLPGYTNEVQADVCWMYARPLQAGKKYFLKHATHTVQCAVTEVVNKLNMSTLEKEPAAAELGMNDIGEIRLRTAKPLVFDGYAANRLTGSFILVEQGSNATVAAGMLLPPHELVKSENGDYVI
jgi:sulfate adenylyltransferase subunit 1 (EFTu-like GTPase family)